MIDMNIYAKINRLFFSKKNKIELPIGTKLKKGTYKIVDIIGKGGFGIVYKAESNNNLYKTVAIKEFYISDWCERKNSKIHITSSNRENYDKLKNRFGEEAKRLQKFQDSHIVGVLDFFEENNTAYIVMKYIEGYSLQDIIEHKKKLPIPIALKYILDIGDALSSMHKRNAVHLDVKPSNIMLDTEGEAILIDFGLTKYYTDRNPKSIKSTIIGFTDGFAPIEQYNNEKKIFEPHSDVYALAATFYYCITGEVPPKSVARSSGEEIIENMSYYNAEVDERLDAVIKKAMEIKPIDRYQSVSEFLENITAVSAVYREKMEEAIRNQEFHILKEPSPKVEKRKNGKKLNEKGEKDTEIDNEEELPPSRLQKHYWLIALCLLVIAAIFIFSHFSQVKKQDISPVAVLKSDSIAKKIVPTIQDTIVQPIVKIKPNIDATTKKKIDVVEPFEKIPLEGTLNESKLITCLKKLDELDDKKLDDKYRNDIIKYITAQLDDNVKINRIDNYFTVEGDTKDEKFKQWFARVKRIMPTLKINRLEFNNGKIVLIEYSSN